MSGGTELNIALHPAQMKVFQSPWEFKQYGDAGMYISELMPHLTDIVDDVTFVRSMHMTPIGRDEPVGAIGVYWATSYTPTAAQQTLLQALADSTVVALETAARWQQQEDELEALRAQLAGRRTD